ANAVLDDPAQLARLEGIIHPLVAASRDAFLLEAANNGAGLVLLDIPLLFETGCESFVDAVVLVTAPESVQKARVWARPGMTAERLAAILARQIPDADKRARAHFIIDTSRGFAAAEQQVREIVRTLAAAKNKV
ncbi:MAG TPA: dephospho-CoA kinase, partial [Methylocella sp.]|nr:dephospho-CoA kinase [Methylocella sp.]